MKMQLLGKAFQGEFKHLSRVKPSIHRWPPPTPLPQCAVALQPSCMSTLMGWGWSKTWQGMNFLRWRENPRDGKRTKMGWEEKAEVIPCYLHVGEGAGQGAGTWPPLLLQSSAQHLKLPLLLPHRGQQGGRTRTLLHSHAESRAQDRTGQGQHQSRDSTSTQTSVQRTNHQ